MHAHPDENIQHCRGFWQGVRPLPPSGPLREERAIRLFRAAFIGNGEAVQKPLRIYATK